MGTGSEGSTMLREVADAAEETAREQAQVAREARRMASQRDRGMSWETITANGSFARLIGLLASGLTRMRGTVARFRRAAVIGLAEEGLTTRQIGERFGVSHQRISALLRSRPGG